MRRPQPKAEIVVSQSPHGIFIGTASRDADIWMREEVALFGTLTFISPGFYFLVVNNLYDMEEIATYLEKGYKEE